MKLQLVKLHDTLADSFWFLPALMALLAAAAALACVAVDPAIGNAWLRDMGWVWSGGAEGALGVLSTIAGSIMTVVSIVFSLTVTALAQTSSHFGPRVLRNFTSDRGVQFTLATGRNRARFAPRPRPPRVAAAGPAYRRPCSAHRQRKRSAAGGGPP